MPVLVSLPRKWFETERLRLGRPDASRVGSPFAVSNLLEDRNRLVAADEDVVLVEVARTSVARRLPS